MTKPSALIVGVGGGLSASLARVLAGAGYDVHLVARDTDKLEALREETHGTLFKADATDARAIQTVVDSIEGRLEIAVANQSRRLRAPLVDLDPAEVRLALEITAFGGFVVGQAAARRMLRQEGPKRGTILFTGATAGVKGVAESAPFAMGKFAQRGLAQSMSRELHPQGVHVVWVNIDGAIGARGDTAADRLDPDSIAQSYLTLAQQDPTAWSNELTLRPASEAF